MKKLIYIAEDEESIRELYECALESGFETRTFETGKELLSALEAQIPDLFILDIMLPEMDGAKLLEIIKANKDCKDVPVIMVSAKSDEISKVKFLNLGADDYLTKPFGVMELIARINANIRKKPVRGEGIGDVFLNAHSYTISVGGSETKIPVKEFELLKYLMQHFGSVCKRDDIFNEVWGIEFECESRTLDMHIKLLREKLEGSNIEIETVRGVGYLLRLKNEL